MFARDVEFVGLREARGIAVSGGHYSDDGLAFAMSIPPSSVSEGAMRAVCWLGLSKRNSFNGGRD